MNLLHYLPLTPHFFLILVGIFLALVALMEFGVLNYVYANIGLRPRTALLLLFASLIGATSTLRSPHCPESKSSPSRRSCSSA